MADRPEGGPSRGLRERYARAILNLSRSAHSARAANAQFRLSRADAASDSGAKRRE